MINKVITEVTQRVRLRDHSDDPLATAIMREALEEAVAIARTQVQMATNSYIITIIIAYNEIYHK